MRVYAACLASYNAGKLFGEWIDLDGHDAETLQEAISAMLERSPEPGAEEWAIHDYDDDTGALKGLGEHPDLEDLCERAEAAGEIESDHGDNAKLIVAWLADRGDDPSDWVSTAQDAFLGVHSDPEDYVAESFEQGMIGAIPESLQGYIDWRAMARDWSLGGDVDFICTGTGAHLQDYDSMRGRECLVMDCHA